MLKCYRWGVTSYSITQVSVNIIKSLFILIVNKINSGRLTPKKSVTKRQRIVPCLFVFFFLIMQKSFVYLKIINSESYLLCCIITLSCTSQTYKLNCLYKLMIGNFKRLKKHVNDSIMFKLVSPKIQKRNLISNMGE